MKPNGSGVEEALVGSDCNAAIASAASAHSTAGQTVASDIHADREYRSELAAIYVRRAVLRAKSRTG